MQNNINTIKIQMVTNHLTHKKGQIIELEEKQAINFLTNGKALKIHRKKDDVTAEKTEEKPQEKENKKPKK
jgi:hypothetical protein